MPAKLTFTISPELNLASFPPHLGADYEKGSALFIHKVGKMKFFLVVQPGHQQMAAGYQIRKGKPALCPIGRNGPTRLFNFGQTLIQRPHRDPQPGLTIALRLRQEHGPRTPPGQGEEEAHKGKLNAQNMSGQQAAKGCHRKRRISATPCAKWKVRKNWPLQTECVMGKGQFPGLGNQRAATKLFLPSITIHRQFIGSENHMGAVECTGFAVAPNSP
ncbi:MAG: hypothetical protein WAT51_04545 [Holophaga sp.]